MTPPPSPVARGRAVVVGSANIDFVYRVDRLPAPGETRLAHGVSRHPGGKGSNQAIAVARAGTPTTFVAALGDDHSGDELCTTLADAGVVLRARRTSSAPTGSALIVVGDDAENTIIVDAGANGLLAVLDDGDRDAIADADVLLLQLEIPLDAVVAAARHARRFDTLVVLNAAPFRPLPDDLLTAIDVLVVNDGEATALGDAVLSRVPVAIVTHGADGATVHDRRGAEPQTTSVRSWQVDAIDTTGAGDSFCGALVAALCERHDLVDAAEFAVAAGALAVQRLGAASSIPTRFEIDALRADPGRARQGPTARDHEDFKRHAGAMDSNDDEARGELHDLTRHECLGLLGAHGVGRLGVIDHLGMPLIVPVNYRLVGAHVVFRTAPGTKVFALQRHPVAFQIDGVDPVNRTGWSVLVQGIAHEMSESERAELDIQPWAKGEKSLWFQIVPRHITGRRLIDPSPFESPGGYL